MAQREGNTTRMTTHQGTAGRSRRLLQLLILACTAGVGPAVAQEGGPGGATMTQALGGYIQLALQKQPRVAAQRASLAAAEDARRALDGLHVPAILDRELPARRRQSALGVTAAVAGVDQAERDAVYAVTRAYYSVLYAREQARVTRGVVERLSAIHDAAKLQLDAGGNVSAGEVQKARVYVLLAEAKQVQASQGVKRALAALREAVGVGPDFALDVPTAPLAEPQARPVREEIITLALSRRGDLGRANLFAAITCLEVEAQGTSAHRKMETFAAGGDVHATQVPQGVSGADEYRPGAVPPEMPTFLAGVRPERMKRAESLHLRARAVAETTRNLIALEAEDAFLRWEQASLEVPKTREAADLGDQMARDVNKDFTAGLRVKLEEVVNARVTTAQARAQYNEAVYRQIVALAELERVTAGGFCAGLIDAAAPQPRLGTPVAGDAARDVISR